MPHCIIIADDLTGANATGVALTKLGLQALICFNLDSNELDRTHAFDVVGYPTGSRAISKEEAYDRVNSAVRLLKSENVKLYTKRIDSTLRGNIGCEVDAMLDALGDDRLCLLTPAYPKAGRVVVGGYLLVHGLPLHQSDAGKDPKAPVNTSLVSTLVSRTAGSVPGRKIESLFLDDINNGADHVSKLVSNLYQRGVRIIVCDAISDNDLSAAVAGVIKSGIGFIVADPGPLTYAAAELLLQEQNPKPKNPKILLSVGSVTQSTALQVQELLNATNTFRSTIDIFQLIHSKQDRNAEINRVVAEITDHMPHYDNSLIVVSSIDPNKRVDFSAVASKNSCSLEEISTGVNEAIAEATRLVIQNTADISAVFSSGGDITVAICSALSATGIQLIDEVMPLAAFGKLIGGQAPELPIVTKGGIVGDSDGMIRCVHYIRHALQQPDTSQHLNI